MSICRSVRTALKLANHWAQETYCSVAQHLGERLETLSDGLAEKRYRSEIHSEPARSAAIPALPRIQLPKYRVIIPKYRVIIPKYRVINGQKYER